jgi:hypothetical protein
MMVMGTPGEHARERKEIVPHAGICEGDGEASPHLD